MRVRKLITVKFQREMIYAGRRFSPGDIARVESETFKELVSLGAAMPAPELGRQSTTTTNTEGD